MIWASEAPQDLGDPQRNPQSILTHQVLSLGTIGTYSFCTRTKGQPQKRTGHQVDCRTRFLLHQLAAHAASCDVLASQEEDVDPPQAQTKGVRLPRKKHNLSSGREGLGSKAAGQPGQPGQSCAKIGAPSEACRSTASRPSRPAVLRALGGHGLQAWSLDQT